VPEAVVIDGDGMLTEVVLRPGRAPYRARRKPYAQLLEDDGDDGAVSVIVWRTHDVDVAVAHAGRAWACAGYGRDPLPGGVDIAWFCMAPWLAGEWVVRDARPDDADAVPAVRFHSGKLTDA
jgi:hypothetical protein